MEPLRRSSRARKPVIRLDYQDIDDDQNGPDLLVEDSGDEFAEHPVPPSRKRTKRDSSSGELQIASSNRRRGRKSQQGCLATLLKMPVDVLYEVFSFLHPLDLLHLARCSKSLRSTLLQRSARAVWSAALASVIDLPDCPADISEPSFASLAFENYCSICGTSCVKLIIWYHRIRCCRNCLNDSSLDAQFLRNLPHPFITESTAFGITSRMSGLRGTRWYRPEVEEVLEAMLPIRGNADALARFTGQRREFVYRRRQEALLLQRWSESMVSSHIIERKSAQQGRRDEIIQRLIVLGFEREINWMKKHPWSEETQNFEKHKLVRAPQVMTPRIWNNIQDELIDCVLSVRLVRLQNLEVETIRERLKLLSQLLKRLGNANQFIQEILPPLPDVVLMEPISKALDQPIEDTDEDPFELIALIDSLAGLPTLTLAWHEQKMKDLMQILRSATQSSPDQTIPSENDGYEDLRLATTFFQCNSCSHRSYISAIYHASNMLVHQCSSTDWRRGNSEVTPSLLLNTAISFSSTFPWNYFPHSIQVDTKASSMAKMIVTLCDLDPRTTTIEDMDDLDPRFVCLSCKEKDKDNEDQMNRCVFNWREAVAHACRIVHNVRLRRLTESRERKVKIAQDRVNFANYPRWCNVWGCRHCTAIRNVDVHVLSTHLNNVHGIFNITPNDFFESCLKNFLPSNPTMVLPVDKAPVRPLKDGISTE